MRATQAPARLALALAFGAAFLGAAVLAFGAALRAAVPPAIVFAEVFGAAEVFVPPAPSAVLVAAVRALGAIPFPLIPSPRGGGGVGVGALLLLGFDIGPPVR